MSGAGSRFRRPEATPAAQPNERWSVDFVNDCVGAGRVIRMLTLLTIVDDCTRECPAIDIDTSLGGLRVRRVRDRIASADCRKRLLWITVQSFPVERWPSGAKCGLSSFSQGKPVHAYIRISAVACAMASRGHVGA